jgi:hypothetical protein
MRLNHCNWLHAGALLTLLFTSLPPHVLVGWTVCLLPLVNSNQIQHPYFDNSLQLTSSSCQPSVCSACLPCAAQGVSHGPAAPQHAA